MDNQTVDTQQPEISFNTPATVEPVTQNAETSAAGFVGKPTSVEPVVSIDQQDSTPPACETPQEPKYYVYPASINVIETNNTGDMLKFEIVFNVSIYNGSDSKNSTVKKIFEVSKSALGNEMMTDIASAKVNVVEEIKQQDVTKKKEDRTANRMRELAGIPGKGTYV